MITTKVSLQLVDQTVPAIIPVVQGDTGRSIIFEPSDFTIPEGATATYYIQKPSGEAVYNSAEITGNTVVCNLTAQSIIETGENNMQVRIILGEDIVTSFDAILMVRPFRGIGAVESETEINIFDKAVEQAEQEISDKADEIIAEKVPELEAIVEEVIESIPADYTALTNKVAAMLADMATEFSAEATYQPGDIVIYGNDLYRKKNGPNITGEWIAAQWEAITLGSAIEQIVGNLAPQYDQTATYHKDDAVIYLGDLYICTSALSVTGTWDASKWSKTDVSSLAPAVDATLTQQGKPADAKAVGDELTDVKADLLQVESALPTETLSGDVVTFESESVVALKNLKVSFLPIQTGSGAAGYDNPRAITGKTGCTVKHSGADTSNPQTIAVSWSDSLGTVYGGTVDLITGILTQEWIEWNLTTAINPSNSGAGTGSTWCTLRKTTTSETAGILTPSGGDGNGLFNLGDWRQSALSGRNRAYATSGYINIVVSSYDYDLTTSAGRTAFMAYVVENFGGLQVVYKLANQKQIQLTAEQISTLVGENNFWSDDGNISVTKYIDIQPAIEDTQKELTYISAGYKAENMFEHNGHRDPDPTATTSSMWLGVDMNGSLVTLDGEWTNNTTDIYLLLSGTGLYSTVSSSTRATYAHDFPFVKGHKYKISAKHISGVMSGELGRAYIYIYQPDASGNVCGLVMPTDGNTVELDLVWNFDKNAQITFMTTKASVDTFDKYQFLLTITDITDNCANEVYYEDEMDETVASVRALMTEPCLVFPLITDAHHLSKNDVFEASVLDNEIRNIARFADQVKCDGVICLGDLTNGGSNSDTTTNTIEKATIIIEAALRSFEKVNAPLFYSIGNHDDLRYATVWMTGSDLYTAYMKWSSSDGVVKDLEHYGVNWYKDFTDMKVRLICIDGNTLPTASTKADYGYTEATRTWLSGVLSDMQSDYTGILICHIPAYLTAMTPQSTFTDIGGSSALRTIIADSGKRIIMLAGHTHMDAAYKNEDGFLTLTTACGKLVSRDTTEKLTTKSGMPAYTWARSRQDERRDLWDVVVYRPTSHLLDMVRFGAGANRSFHVENIAPGTLTTKLTGTVTWFSSDTSVATVSDGVVTGVSAGIANIIAEDENYNTEMWTVEVTE